MHSTTMSEAKAMGDFGPVDAALALAIRRARQADGFSQSELARRAGVSPSVVSRIESGAVKRPDDRTRDRIAHALGRSARLLRAIAEENATYFYGFDELDLDIAVLREAKGEYDRELAKDVSDDAAVEAKWETPIFEAVVDHWVQHRVTDELEPDVDPVTRGALEAFLRTWAGLTEARKELLLRYMDDQVQLSDLERQKPI